jgi:hypothetical protein
VRLAPGAAALKDILATRPSGGVATPEDAARLASRVSRQLRDDPSGALQAFAATQGAAVRSFLATA